jgi:lipid-A-disaccharide synthase
VAQPDVRLPHPEPGCPEHRSSQPGSRVIFISAGEPSGDLHGAGLARALKHRIPGARLIGLGGPRMAAEGVELLADLKQLAVMGLAEVVRHLPFFIRLQRDVLRTLDREGVDLVIPIDYPGFNLRLARRCRERGIPVLYYIAPQVWAWHASRAKQLARDADQVAVILPFEQDFLRRAGADAVFVGHPLLEVSPRRANRESWAASTGIDPRRRVLGLFPGSRAQEVRRHLDLFVRTAQRVATAAPDVQPVIAVAPALEPGLYRGAGLPTTDDAGGLLEFASAALVKSGTTTLEAALMGTPFAVVYRMNPLTYQIAKRLVRVPHIALANLVAGERLVCEFVQAEATPERLAPALLELLEETSPERRRVVEGLDRMRTLLGEPGAAIRVSDMAAELIERRRGSS